LINAIHPEECRIAITQGKELLELEIESTIGKKLKGNIYKAKISRIEPSLQAAFMDIGTKRNGFLQINDIHPSYFKRKGKRNQRNERIRIQDVLSPGQELIVQVVKEERELKGATLTTYLSLPGRYLVVMPGSDRGGISRRIVDSEQRSRLKRLSNELEVPSGIGMIVRTAGLDRSLSELSRDFSLQVKLWERILKESQTAESPSLLYADSDLATRVIRDYFTPEIREILIDDKATYDRVKEFVGQVMPRYRSRVKSYSKAEPIFSSNHIDEQVANTLKPEVKLRSGGEIVIDSLEALVAIDVNSGKATAGGNIEETAYRTNLEAAEEIARQLRLRDLGGLVVIDFIDMLDRRHRSEVEKRMKQAVEIDKARVEVGRLSKFGLLEMSRQRLRASLSSQSHLKCPQCLGSGKVKNHELVALEALRKIQAAVIVGSVEVVKTRLAPSPALFLLNSKKAELARLESEYSCQILILADSRLRPDEYEFQMENKQLMPQENTQAIETLSESKGVADLNGNAKQLDKKQLQTKEPSSSEDIA
ncbi:MAG: Rne/Rng family ribonuclease, partial [Bdellovibrionales bacterium]|nr:Rne/Rng family ribonuclease [Bdellovibrionales bacterium]